MSTNNFTFTPGDALANGFTSSDFVEDTAIQIITNGIVVDDIDGFLNEEVRADVLYAGEKRKAELEQ